MCVCVTEICLLDEELGLEPEGPENLEDGPVVWHDLREDGAPASEASYHGESWRDDL